MPKLLQRGCALEGCHSPDGFNDFRLRSGANGSFAPLALRRNYEAALDEFMALDTIDVKQSRAVKKNIAAASGGTVHRAGPILEDSVPIDTACPQPFDPATATRAFCVFKEWHRIERADRAADGVADGVGQHACRWRSCRVRRTATRCCEFDTFAGGADLKLADATHGRERRGHQRRQHPQRRSGRARASPPAPPTSAAPSGATTAARSIFAGRPSAAQRPRSVAAGRRRGGTCRQLTNDGGRMVSGRCACTTSIRCSRPTAASCSRRRAPGR